MVFCDPALRAEPNMKNRTVCRVKGNGSLMELCVVRNVARTHGVLGPFRFTRPYIMLSKGFANSDAEILATSLVTDD